jgi:NADH dehydrogenase [ubiquinone] 1 alpha subcomplex assembly factor 7
VAQIRERGPISVETYMAACNAHYYATRDPLGSAGDFTTAPEISQIFGELVGACLADSWLRAGAPTDIVYVELGPGRGTLAADALRVLAKAGFAGEIHLVETSPLLREAQRLRVPGAIFHERIEDLPHKPMLLVANEFLDALPVRQWIGDEERRITLRDDRLEYLSSGLVIEDSPARDDAVTAIARWIVACGGLALLIDYGHERSAAGDTLQAVSRHRFADPLDRPGEQDLTAHVDFEAAGKAARQSGAAVTAVVRQGDWLTRLGIHARAEALVRHNPAGAKSVGAAVERLTDPSGMGELFKVMAVHSPDWPARAGFDS